MEAAHSGPSMHRLTNFAISVDGDRATARTYVDAVVFASGANGMHSIGYYDDVLVRTAAGWKIAERSYTTVHLKFIGALSVMPRVVTRKLAAMGARQTNKKLG